MSNTIIYNGEEYGNAPTVNPTGVGEFVGNDGEKNPEGSNNERFNDYRSQGGNQINGNAIYSSILGSENQLVNGQYTIVGGYSNSIAGTTVRGNVIIGVDSSVQGETITGTIVGGGGHTVRGNIEYSVITGQGHSISGNTIHSNAIFGTTNTLNGVANANIVGGNQNILQGTTNWNIVGGSDNTLQSIVQYNIVGGNQNIIANSLGTLVVGNANKVTGENIYYNIVGGSQNNVGGSYSIVSGMQNTLCSDSSYNLITGYGGALSEHSTYGKYLDFRNNYQTFVSFFNSILQNSTYTSATPYVNGIVEGSSNVKTGQFNAVLNQPSGASMGYTYGAAVFGTDNITSGSYSFVIGQSNVNFSNVNFVSGHYNIVAGYSGTNITKINGHSQSDFKPYITVAGAGSLNFITGVNNLVLTTNESIVGGDSNTSIGNATCQVSGTENIIMFSAETIIDGINSFAQRLSHSIVSGSSNKAIGTSTSSSPSSDFVIGQDNILVDSNNSILTGDYAYINSSNNSYLKSGRPYVIGTASSAITSYQRIGNTSDHYEDLYTVLSPDLLITPSETLDTRSTILTTIIGSQGATNESSGGIITGADYSHLEGTTIVDHTNEKIYRHSIDNGSIAGHVEGGGNYLTDGSTFSHIEGSYNKLASSSNTHIEGSNNLAQFGASVAHVEGTNNIAQTAVGAHIEGSTNTINSSPISHAEGFTNHILNNSAYGHAEGSNNTIETSTNGHIEGSQNSIVGSSGHGHIEGANNTISAGAQYAHLEGTQNAISNGSNGGHIEGFANTITNGSQYSHAEGSNNLVSNASGNAHIEGANNTITDGSLTDANHAEGSDNYIRKSRYAHAEGYKTFVGPWNSADEQEATPSGELYSEAVHVEGYGSKASGKAAHAQGLYTVANADAQASLGRYNTLDSTPTYANPYGTYAIIVGNGTTTTTTRATYDAEATYEIDDEVIYEGVIYKCITAISEAEEFDSTKWEVLDIELIGDQEVTRSNAATLSWNGYLDVAGGFSINGTPIATSSTPNANPNISDAYSNTSTYSEGDYCIYNNNLYKCNTAISVAEDFDTTKWTATTIAAELLSVITRVSALETQLNGYSFASAMTQSDYDDLDPDYDADTIYPIIEEN